MLALRPRRSRAPTIPFHAKLDTPLLALSRQDRWTIRDACQGTQIFGGTGSGKTSGAGKAVAHAYLRAGMGGLVLCAKPDEAERWIGYAQETGRAQSIVRFNGEGAGAFNFLEYAQMVAPGNGLTDNLVALFRRIHDAINLSEEGSAPRDTFWIDNAQILLSNAIDLLYCAHGRIRLADVDELVTSAAQTQEEAESDLWKSRSFCFKAIQKTVVSPSVPMDETDLNAVLSYWRYKFPGMPSKTRGGIVTTLNTMLAPFLKGKMRELFCTRTSIVPEMSQAGAVILMDFPIKRWGQFGIVAQHIFKYLWQLSIERRAVTDATRPCFLWADECQFFISPYDAEFLSTARGARACTVFITQNLPTYYAQIGGPNARDTANALIGNFQTKIFHSNADFETNRYAADLIGRRAQFRRNASYGSSTTHSLSNGLSYGEGRSASHGSTTDAHGNTSYSSTFGTNSNASASSTTSWARGDNSSEGVSEVIDYDIEPNFFTVALRTGGPQHGGQVDALVFQAGRFWKHSKRNWIPCTYAQ